MLLGRVQSGTDLPPAAVERAVDVLNLLQRERWTSCNN
jgi:hypothetical protein